MNSTRFSRTALSSLSHVSIVLIACSLSAMGQVKTETSETAGAAIKEVTIERGEIAYLKGNTVVVKMDNGELRSFENVPDSTTFTVDGRPVNIHTARVGMVLEKQTAKITTPKVITTVETVTGKVWQVSPPKSVILTLQDGTNQRFNIPEGQKFLINGKETDAFGLRKGMTINAQRVTEVPMTVVAEAVKRTGKTPTPPPEVLNVEEPLLVAVSMPAPPVPATETAPKSLPKTATNLPIIGLLGTLLCGLSLSCTVIRKTSSRFKKSGP